MEAYAKENQWKWMENPVYETFSTPYLSYSDVLFLKDVEILVDAFYNSGIFSHTMNYIKRNLGFWNFFSELAKIGREAGAFEAARRETYWFEFLADKFSNSKLNSQILYDLLRYDFVLRGKQGGFPGWYKHNYNKNRHRELLEEQGGVTNARLDFAYSEYEVFDCNVDCEFPEAKIQTYEKLIKYSPKGISKLPD